MAIVKKGTGYEIAVPSNPVPVTLGEQKRRFVTRFVCGIVNRTADSVRNMPMLTEPIFDADVLSDENVFAQVVYTWTYAFRRFEYTVEPTRRGFAAWLRIIFTFLFYAGIPFCCLSALCLGMVYIVTQVLVLTDLTVNILWNIVIGMCLILGAIFLGYVIYAVIATLRGNTVKVPVPEFEFVKPSKK